MYRLWWLLILLAIGSGCTNTKGIIAALAKDPATVCLSVSSIYVNLKLARTNIRNGDVACVGDGLTVKSQGTTTVPVTVIPTPSATTITTTSPPAPAP